MKPSVAISFMTAVLFHALLLFGFRLRSPAKPFAMNDEPSAVAVNLVAAPAEVETEASRPEPAPTPEPSTPVPAPTPVPEAPLPEPTPIPIPASATTPESTCSPPKPALVSKPRAEKSKPPSQPHPTGPANLYTAAREAGVSGDSVGVVTTGAHARYQSNPAPEYPADARRNHQQGVVMLSVEVGADGMPKAVTLKQTSGVPALDKAAIQAVRRWKFDPAIAGGLPMASRVDVPVRFSLAR